MSPNIFASLLLPFLLGGLAACLVRHRPALANAMTSAGIGAGATLALIVGLWAAITGSTLHGRLPDLLPFDHMSVRLDPVAGFFVAVIGLALLLSAIYSVGYMREYFARGRILVYSILFSILGVAMLGVVTANHAILFLLWWETMSLSSYGLVALEHEHEAARRGSFIYLLATHVGTAFLFLCFLLLAQSANGSFSFESFRHLGGLTSTRRSIIFLCALIGFGTKAGLVPMHLWLPHAHPVAPSNVSGIMSGVMIKTAIYGLLRVTLEFLQGAPAWGGIALILLGAGSALVGALFGLFQRDYKRLLAFSSIENIGLICLGLGMSFALFTANLPALAGLALTAALYHVLNHSIFKNLLFMGAGAVLSATHTRQMDALGGLIRRLPITALCFLTAVLAVSAVPPLNGFQSEWLLFQALFAGSQTSSLTLHIIGTVGLLSLGIVAGLVAMLMVKVFGIVFLGAPRSSHAENAHEVDPWMRSALVAAAVLCMLLGIFPGAINFMLHNVIATVIPEFVPPPSLTAATIFSSTTPSNTTIMPVMVIVIMAAASGLLFFGWRIWRKDKIVRRYRVWDCGFPAITARMQYTSPSFSQPVAFLFRQVVRPRARLEIKGEGTGGRFFPSRIRFESEVGSFLTKWFFAPLHKVIVRASLSISRLQSGNIQLYLAYLFATILVLLIFYRN